MLTLISLQSPLLSLHYILSCGFTAQIKNALTSLISAGNGEWNSGGGAAGDTWNDGTDAGANAGAAGDTWNDGTEAGANAGDDLGAANGEVVTNESGGGDFTCRR